MWLCLLNEVEEERGVPPTKRLFFPLRFEALPANAPPNVARQENLDALLQSAGDRAHNTLSNCVQTGNTVSCDDTISGGPLPPLPHPPTAKLIFTFSDAGLVTHIEDRLSDTTRDDFEAAVAAYAASGAGAPGMPTTGSPSDNGVLFFIMALGALLSAVGMMAHRAGRLDA